MTTELKPTKKATRNYYSYSDSPWSIWDVIYGRRSHRKYEPMKPSAELVDSLEKTVDLACRTRGVGPENIKVITESRLVNEVRQTVYTSFQGGINTWLAMARPWAFLVAEIPWKEIITHRPGLLPNVCIALEDIVLWLVEKGMGTCWIGGLNDKGLSELLKVEEGLRIPLIIPVGKPVVGLGFSYDSFTAQSMSKRRKSLQKIASLEDASRPYDVTDIPKKSFSAVKDQGICDLLNSIGENGNKSCEADINLVIDACLEAARVAPSGSNFQPWHFVVVRSIGKLEMLANFCGAEDSWKAAIVAAGKTGRVLSRFLEKPFWMIDVPISVSHISLMAASMDCPADLMINGIDEKAVNRMVGLPGDERTVGVLGIR